MSVRLSCLLIVTLLAAAGCASTPSSGSGQGSGQGGGAGQPAQPATTGTAGTAGTAGAVSTAGAGAASTAGAGATATPAAGSANGPGQTSDERRAAIDKRLNDSLGAFDAELRQEQQTLAKERDARQAAAAGTAATEGQNGDKNGEAAGSTATEGPPGGDGKGGDNGKHPGPGKRRDHSGDLKSEKAGKTPDDNAGNGATAREIPDGSDDDVVARRLRQAAQQETDPELKEKLWQEYLDYKKNAQGKGA